MKRIRSEESCAPREAPHFLRVVRALARLSGAALPVAAIVSTVVPGCHDGTWYGEPYMPEIFDGGAGGGGGASDGHDGGPIGTIAMPDGGESGAGGAGGGRGAGGAGGAGGAIDAGAEER
jgi:hypothetical protein